MDAIITLFLLEIAQTFAQTLRERKRKASMCGAVPKEAPEDNLEMPSNPII
jgi:hypothetical protein